MSGWLRVVFDGRPGWMNALMVFCAYMAFVYVPWDFFWKPAARDEEVWFGIMFTGAWAKLTEPFHWAVYAAGAYGFYHMRSWMHPWAAVYVAQIAVGMLVWSLAYGPSGFGGLIVGLVSFAAFWALTMLVWRSRPLFETPRPSLRERYGEWAIVTGASAGIGKAFAHALAEEGLSVVLSARNKDRLKELASEVEKRHAVATRVVAVDLSTNEGADELSRAVSDLEVGVLVNNAGQGYSGRFDRLETDRLREMVLLNCVAPVVLTSRLLSGMTERGRGAVIVTGSIAGRQPLPFHAVYSATKAFDLLFGEALSVELRDLGVDVLVLEPGPTETEFQYAAGEIAHGGEPPEAVVALALDSLGRQVSVISGWLNWIRANLAARLLPRRLVAYIAREVAAARTPAEMR